ncbi:MAG: hypothetical protein ABR545_08210 [Cyclonatronaceae bacterium]
MKSLIIKYAIILFALITIGFASCTEKQPTQDEIVRKNAEEALKSRMNDPESYEFASLELIDSVLYSDNIEFRRDLIRSDIRSAQGYLDIQQIYKEHPITNMYNQEIVDVWTGYIEESEGILAKIDSLEILLGEGKNAIASYTYLFSFRGNNSFGAKTLNEYILQTEPAPGFKVINMTDDQDELNPSPNEFPGYREMSQ